MNHLRSNVWLLALTLLACCVVYPAFLFGVGRILFPHKAEGSLMRDAQGRPIGSRLIAQPFTGDQYFHPRPSAAGYNAAATGGTNWGASNVLLRDRVARQLGPIVRYGGGPRKGERVGPDVERWFRQDRLGGKPGLVAEWAAAHPTLAANWVKADPINAAFVAAWQEQHPDEVARWKRDHPDAGDPRPEDLAVPFFASFSKEHPGTFPAAVERAAGGSIERVIEPIREGPDIQAMFFDLWLQEHADAALRPVPADMVMASGSGMDPHITLKNARYQLDRVASTWAEMTKRDRAQIRSEIETLLLDKCAAPLGGLAGAPLVNVLEINLALRERYEAGQAPGAGGTLTPDATAAEPLGGRPLPARRASSEAPT